jgi:hypothetical protein
LLWYLYRYLISPCSVVFFLINGTAISACRYHTISQNQKYSLYSLYSGAGTDIVSSLLTKTVIAFFPNILFRQVLSSGTLIGRMNPELETLTVPNRLVLPGLRPDLPPAHNVQFCNNPALSVRTGIRPPRPAIAEAPENPRRKTVSCIYRKGRDSSFVNHIPDFSRTFHEMGRGRKNVTDTESHVNQPFPPPPPFSSQRSYVPISM